MSIGSYSSTVDLKNNPAFENIESDLESVLTENNSIDRSRFDTLNCPVCQRLDGDPTECFHVNTHQMTTKYPVSSKSKEELIQSLHTYLHAVSLESVVLKSEVEVLRKAFDSKCRAVDILRSENSATVNTRSPDSTTSEDALTVHEELNRVRLELEKVKGTLIANHHAWNTKVQQ
ncbi:hypothetical protein D915_009996 [Fasciola hepatica]|uniref:Uncharacterized protein n=1 Tax=Fasciola hepatica TaxID=6192 RepID=A0A4E0QXW5_FASHE|nr:hypothetical protein D915_009996 [Fasciola hepatica]